MSELELDWTTESREPNWVEWAEAQKRWLWVVLDESDFGMEWREPRPGRNRNVFKGSFLVSTLLDQHSNRFKSRAAAVKFAKKLFRECKIKSIFGANYFEDSAQLYMWNDDVLNELQRNVMTSKSVDASKESRYDRKVIDDARNRCFNRGEQINLVKPFSNLVHRTEKDLLGSDELESILKKRNAEVVRYVRGFSKKYLGEKQQSNPQGKVISSPIRQFEDLSSHHHKSIPIMSSEKMDPKEFEMVGNVTGTMNSRTSSAVTGESMENNRRWGENAYSYSDNEKQLIEEMKRMKKEHQHILKTYEERINKLMAKMHELRSIAEMLENSSTKSSPYGILPHKANILSIIGSKLEEERKQAGLLGSHDEDAPPPLPPRPSRGNKVYPNKPIIHTNMKMKSLPWTRIIVADETDNGPTSIWHSMMEPKIDGEELEKLFCATKETLDDISLFDDIYVKRGRPKQQFVNIFENAKTQRIIMEMRNVRCTMNDLIHSVSHLDTKDISQESLAQLLDLISSSRDIEKVLHHIKRKGATQLDYPEYLISELSKIDHFRERLDFLRFKEKLQINLFEIEQQLRELHTACDEITNSIALKNLLGTLLTIGNYLNGGTERGQADGYHLDILSKLKDVSNKTHRGNLHEFIVKSYCKIYESDVEWGCPTRFRLPEPSNMRHAAQVSFDDIQRALSSLRQELHTVKDRIENLTRKENSKVTYQLKVISDNYLTSAVEVLSEEDKLLEDTKKYFTRTTIFFNHDSRNCTPQEFFQIWASFLHDTKFYWKLAHRNIAKAKFEHDFASKSQMSSASHHSRGRYRSEVRKHLLNLGDEHDRHISRAQQLKHINNWIESVGKYAEEIKTEIPPPSSSTRAHSSKNDNKHHSSNHRSNRPSSPKPLTSTPPNVHKPLALSHNSPTQTVAPFNANGHHNYINQESPYDTLKEQNGGHDNMLEHNNQNTASSPEHSSQKKNNTQFSLRSWLKREQTKRGDDGNNAQKSLTPGSTGTLGKIRNTVVNKFSNSKRPNDAQQETAKNENERRSKDTGVNCSSQHYPHPQNIHYSPEMNGNMLPEPNMFMDRAKGDYQGLYFEVPISRDSGYQGQNSNPSTLSSTKSRDLSPPKYDYNKEKQFTNPRQFEIKTPPNNDVNNNKKHRSIPPETPPKPLRSKDRAALAQMNEHNINDGYVKNASTDATIPQTSVMKSESVPIYKAKLIPNYENQTKMDSRMQGVRCHAEPLSAAHKPQLSNSSDAYRNELARKSEMFIKLGYQSAGNQPKYTNTLSPEAQRITGSNSDFNKSPQQHFGEYPARRSASTQDILEKHTNTIVSPHSSSEPRQISNHRPTGNSSSVTNLIDRFEKSPIQIEGEKPPSMTSTPLTHRRNPQVLKDHESYNIIPHKPRSLDRTHQRSRETSQQRHRGSSPNRRQNFQTSPPQLQHDYDHESSAGRNNPKLSTHPIPKPRRGQASTLSPSHQQNQQPVPFQHQNYHNQGQFNRQQGQPHYHLQSSQHQHQHNSKQDSNLQVSPQYGVYKAVPVSYPKSSPDNAYGFSDPEDNNYSDQLRKASKVKGNGTAFDRYQSTTSPQYSRHMTGAMAVVHPTVVHQPAMEI